ncbi:MAG TPA: PPC domain-containing DNA-binding protein [Bryobacteraceae bacterium]|nr:PPC domain-containing DNA-binding protein [Bryobacteraceae bacterium]
MSRLAVSGRQEFAATLLATARQRAPALYSVIMQRLLLSCILAGLLLAAQQTHRDEVRSLGAAEDARANSPNVPDAEAINGHFDRIAIVRLKYQTDLLAGLEKIVQQQHIRNAVILSAIGSVRNYQVHAVSNRTFPSRDTFTQDPSAPADVIGMSGYVIDGRIHAHISMATPEKAFGGHLEPGTNVFTFVAVTIGVLADPIDIRRIDDKTYR